MKRAKGPLTIFLLMMFALSSGCVTGIVSNPDLNRLVYDDEGVLRYNGKRVEGIKLELPWYKEMWPDNGPEWAFTLVTVGAAAAASGGGGGGSSSEDVTEEPVAVTTTSTSRPKSDPEPEETTPTDGGGGGGGGGGSTPPPGGGGIELPF